MANMIFHILDITLLVGVLISGFYILLFSIPTLFYLNVKFPSSLKQCKYAILLPENSDIQFENYSQNLYEIIHYSDICSAVALLDETQFDAVIILGSTTRVSSNFLIEVNDAFSSGVCAMQLHHVTEGKLSGKKYYAVLNEEIRNSLLKLGHNRLGLPAAFDSMDVVLDMTWLKNNFKTPKANLENRLLHQGVYIYYLPYIHVYSNQPRPRSRNFSRRKAFLNLLPILAEGNWGYLSKLIRCFLPTWRTVLYITFLWSIIVSFIDWKVSVKWWFISLTMLFIICIAIPDYLIQKKK